MKARFVKKILLGPDKGKNLYWLKRVIKASFWLERRPQSCESTSNLSSQEKKKGGKL